MSGDASSAAALYGLFELPLRVLAYVYLDISSNRPCHPFLASDFAAASYLQHLAGSAPH